MDLHKLAIAACHSMRTVDYIRLPAAYNRSPHAELCSSDNRITAVICTAAVLRESGGTRACHNNSVCMAQLR